MTDRLSFALEFFYWPPKPWCSPAIHRRHKHRVLSANFFKKMTDIKKWNEWHDTLVIQYEISPKILTNFARMAARIFSETSALNPSIFFLLEKNDWFVRFVENSMLWFSTEVSRSAVLCKIILGNLNDNTSILLWLHRDVMKNTGSNVKNHWRDNFLIDLQFPLSYFRVLVALKWAVQYLNVIRWRVGTFISYWSLNLCFRLTDAWWSGSAWAGGRAIDFLKKFALVFVDCKLWW